MLMVNYTWLCQMQQVRKLSNLVVREVDLTHFVFCFSTERKKMSRNRIERKKEGNSQYFLPAITLLAIVLNPLETIREDIKLERRLTRPVSYIFLESSVAKLLHFFN